MAETLADVAADSLIDTLKTFPFLFGVYLLIEYIERRHTEGFTNALRKLGFLAPVGGALIGSAPQCGFSAAASNLYAGRLVTCGTLVSIYIATSDEAIPLLISQPEFAGSLWILILLKILIAIITGILVDTVVRLSLKSPDRKAAGDSPDFEDLCCDCDCEHRHFAVSALIHSLKISLFILIVGMILGAAIEFLGEDSVSDIMMSGSFFQPFIAALFGFIPNCAASVIITDLYIEGVLSFGSCVAGLCTGAGVGLLVLFRVNKHLKQNFSIVGILYIAAVISGIVINLLG